MKKNNKNSKRSHISDQTYHERRITRANLAEERKRHSDDWKDEALEELHFEDNWGLGISIDAVRI